MEITKLLYSYVNNEKVNIEINDSDLKLLIEQSLQTLSLDVMNKWLYYMIIY